MPLDTTPGAPTANSYASVAEADAYNAARPFATSWAALTPEAKEGALQYAALLLDASFVWTGAADTPVPNPDQVMCWPRTGMFTRNGQPIDPMAIPMELKYAQSEYARATASGDITADDDAAKAGLSSVKAGSVSVGFQDRKNAEKIVLSGSDYTYLGPTVPQAVRILLVPSWYEQQKPIIAALGQRGGFMFEADR